jgi:hypothetical protein
VLDVFGPWVLSHFRRGKLAIPCPHSIAVALRSRSMEARAATRPLVSTRSLALRPPAPLAGTVIAAVALTAVAGWADAELGPASQAAQKSPGLLGVHGGAEGTCTFLDGLSEIGDT